MNIVTVRHRLNLSNLTSLTGKLPVAPHIFGRITSLLADGGSSIDAIAELVNQDTGMAAQTLKIANGVLFGFRTPAATTEEAILRTGIREIQRLVGLANSSIILKANHEMYQTTGDFVWEHSVLTAIAMKQIAVRGNGDPSVAYTVGLMRPLGRLLIAIHVGRTTLNVRFEAGAKSVPDWEREEFGVTYAEVGGAACDVWRFPKPIGEALRDHLSLSTVASASAYAHMLGLACHIATQLGRGLPGEEGLFSDDPVRFRKTGALPEDIEEITDNTILEFDRTKTLLSILRA